MARSRVELFEQIRKVGRVEGASIRELADRHRVHRPTVRHALTSTVPPPHKPYPQRPGPAIDQYARVIDAWLVADLQVPRKQRHTARRIWQRLVAEHGATCSEVSVSRYVAHRRVDLGLQHVDVAVPQVHLPGAEAEVDFGEFHAMIAGVLVKLWLFVLRLSCSGRAFHVAFATQAREAFLEGMCWRSSTSAACRPGSSRQSEARGDRGPEWPGPGRGGAVRRAALALRVRLVFLHPRQAGSA